MRMRGGSNFDIYNASDLVDPMIASHVYDLMIRFTFLL